MFAAMNSSPTAVSRDHNKKIVKMIQALLAYEQSNIFRKPIHHKSLGWQDYKDIIKRPIDLNFVRRQYNEGKYKSVEQVLDQIQLIWDNVFIYGKRDHESYENAIKMVKHFDQLLNDLLPEFYQKLNRVQYFKQFEPVKSQKKSSSISNNDKNHKKIEKMDVENPKEEIKNQKNLRGTISTRRRQHLSDLKQQNQQKSISTPLMITQNIQETKKKALSQQKIVQNKKTANKIHQIDIQDPIKAEQQKQIPIVQTKVVNKQNESLQSKIPLLVENSVAQILQVQAQNQQRNPFVNLSVQPSQPFDAEESQQNHFPPILVNLNKTPSIEQVSQITQIMRLLFELQQMQILSKVVKILTKYEKQNMIIDGEDVNFRMNNIHISTYTKIRKELQQKIHQLQQSQKIKDLNHLKEKFNIKLENGFDSKINQNGFADSKIIEQN